MRVPEENLFEGPRLIVVYHADDVGMRRGIYLVRSNLRYLPTLGSSDRLDAGTKHHARGLVLIKTFVPVSASVKDSMLIQTPRHLSRSNETAPPWMPFLTIRYTLPGL